MLVFTMHITKILLQIIVATVYIGCSEKCIKGIFCTNEAEDSVPKVIK